MSAEELDEISDVTPPPTGAAPVAAAVPAYAYAPQPADPRLYRFFWCAMACAIGALMPFTTENPEWLADKFNPVLRGPLGFETFYGALIGFFALIVAAEYSWCIKYRKVRIWPLLVMLPIVVAPWVVLLQGLKAKTEFAWKGKDAAHAATSVPGGAWADIRFWNSLFTHVGSGWFLGAARLDRLLRLLHPRDRGGGRSEEAGRTVPLAPLIEAARPRAR